MIAIEINTFGGPEVLQARERPKPQPTAREVLIRVEAAGVARADVLQRQGKYPPPPGVSDIPGLDVAGVIKDVGAGVTSFAAGQRVCAILAGGGYAEYVVAPEEQVLPLPEGWTAIEAATLPENLFTVYDNLVTRAGLTNGERVLIHGGSSGIGTMAAMLSRARGTVPIGTAGTPEKCAAILSFGFDAAINYRTQDFVAETKRLTEGRGADAILDMVGAPYLDRNLDALAPEGRIVVLATQGGYSGPIDLRKLMAKRARLMGSTMRTRSPAEKKKVRDALWQEVWPLLPGKEWIRPVLDSTFPLSQAAQAHQLMESGAHVGKIVLVP